MTNNTDSKIESADAIRDRIMSRYENLKFAPLTKVTDPAKNRRRGSRKSPRRRSIL